MVGIFELKCRLMFGDYNLSSLLCVSERMQDGLARNYVRQEVFDPIAKTPSIQPKDGEAMGQQG